MLCTECYKIILKARDFIGMNEHSFLGFRQNQQYPVVKKE